MIIRDKEHFLHLVKIYQEGFGSSKYILPTGSYQPHAFYFILKAYMDQNNITPIPLPHYEEWYHIARTVRDYEIVCTAFKENGEYYTSLRNNCLITSSLTYIDDMYELHRIREELMQDLDAACGLNPGSIASNNYTVLVEIFDIYDKNPCIFKALIKP